jgi:hypothetical protein
MIRKGDIDILEEGKKPFKIITAERKIHMLRPDH